MIHKKKKLKTSTHTEVNEIALLQEKSTQLLYSRSLLDAICNNLPTSCKFYLLQVFPPSGGVNTIEKFSLHTKY